MIQMLNTILPVILILTIGIICRRTNLLTREGINAIKNVVVNITLPAVLLNAFMTMVYSWKNIVITVLMFAICLIAWFLGKVFQKIFHMQSRFVPFLSTGFEAGMLGYALFPLLYGTERTSEFATVDLGQVLFVFTLYKLLLGMDEKKNDKGTGNITLKVLLKEMVTSPVVIAIAVGVLLGATGIYQSLTQTGAASVLTACTDFVSAPTGAIILLTIGYDLVLTKIPWKKVASISITRIIIMAVMRIIAGFVVHAIGMGESLDLALNVMMILPAPFVLPVFADDENEREYVSASLSVMTLISIIGFMFLAFIQ